MTPCLVDPKVHGGDILALMHRAFAAMEGRINPPSSIARLTLGDLGKPGTRLVAIGTRPRACAMLTPQPNALYIGKMAVDPAHQGQGLGGQLLTFAETHARDLGLGLLRLESRIELVENHRFFTAHGFEKIAETAHPGFDRPTSLIFEKVL